MDTTPTPGTAADPAASASAVSRRERKKQQTRQALRREALRLFGERGFDATTIHDITEAADVAPRTFFLHFGSKEDVLLGDARDGVAAFEEMLRDRPDDEDVFTAVRETVIGLLALDDTPVEETRLQARLMIDAPSLMGRVYEHYVEFEEIIARAVADRFGLDAERDAYPRLLSTCAMTAVRVALVLWYQRGEKEPLADVVAELFTVLGDGLATAEVRSRRG
jgi:AcrR family transcriptional regulator